MILIGISLEETKTNLISKAKASGHVNEKGEIKQLFFYSLMPPSSKYQLKKDMKREIYQVQNGVNEPEIKKMKKTSEAFRESESPVRCPNFSAQRIQEEESKQMLNDPKIQTIIQITFTKMDEVKQIVEIKFKDLSKRVSQVENQITGIAHKVRSLQQSQRSTTSSRGRGNIRRARARGGRQRNTNSRADNIQEVEEELGEEIEEEEEEFWRLN